MVPLDFQGVIKLITDYGVTIIIVSVFLYTVIKLINLGLSYLEDKLGRKKHDTKLDLRQAVGTKIQTMICNFLEQHDGDRIQVIEFSNSVMSVAYLPFRYMSCTYEICRPGKRGVGQRLDRISTSLFTQFFDKLQETDYLIVDTSKPESCISGSIQDIMHDMDETKCLCTMLYTPKGKCIGYIAFYKHEGFGAKDTVDIDYLRDSISSLLSVVS